MTESSGTGLQLPPLRYKIGEEVNKPGKGINNFSSFEYLNELRKILGGSLFSRLENTFLGPIIKAGSRKEGGAQKSEDGLGFSGQLIHFLLSRQIKTTREEELWFHFDGQPMRFSLREFHLVTGLPCWETQEEEAPIEEDRFVWPLCDDDTHTCGDLLKQIKQLGADEEEGKLRLSMLLLIESIFLMRYLKCKLPRSSVEIARSNIRSYPWGEVAFKILISSINSVCDRDLEKGKYSLKGFPMALQLWFLASVPNLEAAFARLDSPSRFVCARYIWTYLPTFSAVWVVEKPKDAKVIPVLGDSDDKNDDDLAAVVTLVNRGYRVSETDWSRNFIDLEEAEKFISLTCGAQNDGSHETTNVDVVGEDTLPSSLLQEQDRWCIETLLGFQDATKSSYVAHPSSTKARYQTRSGRPIVAPSKFTPESSSNELKLTTRVRKQRLLSI